MLLLPDLVLALLEHGRQLAKVVLLATLVEPVPEDDGLEPEPEPRRTIGLDQPRRLLVEPADALLVRHDRLGDLRRHGSGRWRRTGTALPAQGRGKLVAGEEILKFDQMYFVFHPNGCECQLLCIFSLREFTLHATLFLIMRNLD